MPIPADREVSVVGSHIHPTRGGYDERRYLQLWGRVSDGVRFAPVRAWGWDETEMPFFEYSERSVPQSRRYLTALSAEKGADDQAAAELLLVGAPHDAPAVPVGDRRAGAAGHLRRREPRRLHVVDRAADPHRCVVRAPGDQRHERHLRHALRSRRREPDADAVLRRIAGRDLRPRLGSRAGAARRRPVCRRGRHRPGARGHHRVGDPAVDRGGRDRARESPTPRRR